MAWHGIEGHDVVVDKLRRAIARNRLASSFLFCGPAGVGKRAFALRFAQALLCHARPAADLDPCNVCPNCAMALAGTHPDIEVVAKPEDKAFLPVKLFIGEGETRGHEGICHWISLKPFMGGRRIAIIDDADFFNDAGANCLLKTLEEPPPQSVLILIGTSPARQLPTIRSRCQLIRFQPLAEETVARLLVSQGLVDDRAEAVRLAQYSEGSLQRAIELADEELWSCRRTLLEKLSAAVLDSTGLAQAVSAFIGKTGRRPPPGGPSSARWYRLRPTSIVGCCTFAANSRCPQTPSCGAAGGGGAVFPRRCDRGRGMPGAMPGGPRPDRPQRQPGDPRSRPGWMILPPKLPRR